MPVIALLSTVLLSATSLAHVITNPNWVQAPSGEILWRFYPSAALAQGISGRSVIACKVRISGDLGDCHVTSEDPSGFGFGDAELRMLALYRMTPQKIDGVPTDGADVTIPVNWSADASAQRGASAWFSRVMPLVNSPSALEIGDSYPKAALASGIAGSATIRCSIGAEGDMNACTVESEQPQGLAFGAAALSLAPKYRAATTTDQGDRTQDALATLTVEFRPTAQAQAPTPTGR